MTQFITRAYNQLLLNPLAGIITKKSSENRLVDEFEYLTKIQTIQGIQSFFPRIFSKSFEIPYSMEMEYFPFQNLGVLALEEYNEKHWQQIIKNLGFALKSFGSKLQPANEGTKKQSFRKVMFLDKTETEQVKLKEQFEFFKILCAQEYIEINGKRLLSFESVWPHLKQIVETTLCSNDDFSIIHGDFCFANILCGTDKADNVILKFVDPRGSFGDKGIFGDPIYDLAKLAHSSNGKYDLIIRDQFKLFNETSFGYSFSFEESLNDKFDKIDNLFQSLYGQGMQKMKIELVQGLIFIGMCARHYDSLSRQKVMYAIGLEKLNSVFQATINRKSIL